MAPETIYQTPPLAGRPPYATDDDSAYNNQQQASTGRIRQPPPPDPNARTSAYNVYDNYMDEKTGSNRDSGIGALGMGLMNGDMDDEDPFDDSHKPAPKQQTYPDEKQQLRQHYAQQQQQQQSIPLAAPKPGYAAQVAALQMPSPAASPDGRSPVKPLTLVTNMNGANPRVPPPAAINVPSTPHPLQPPMTPIMPIFARPADTTGQRDVKFASGTPILRGEKEDTLLPRRRSQWGEKGDNFWRRFSMVVKVEDTNQHKESNWLKKTKNGDARTSRWIWVIGMALLLLIAGAIGLGVWVNHNNTTHSAPTAIGGSANQKAVTTDAAPTVAGALATSSPHVSPTHTVARRANLALPTPHIPDALLAPVAAAVPIEGSGSEKRFAEHVPAGHKRHKRHALNRTLGGH